MDEVRSDLSERSAPKWDQSPGRGYFVREFRRYLDCGILVHSFAPERHADLVPVRRAVSIVTLCAASFTVARDILTNGFICRVFQMHDRKVQPERPSLPP